MILEIKFPELNILADFKMFESQNPEFKILESQNSKFKILAHFNILKSQNSIFKILAAPQDFDWPNYWIQDFLLNSRFWKAKLLNSGFELT